MAERTGRVAAAARARSWAVAVLAGLAVAGCGAGGPTSRTRPTSPTPAPGHRLALDDQGRVTGCTGYGHSGIEGYGVAPAQAFLTLVCRHYGDAALNLGIGGSTLQGQLAQVLGEVPAGHARQLSIVMWGANDLALFGPRLAGFQAGLRLLVSRLRTPAGWAHGADDGALRYHGRWTQAFGERVTAGDAGFTWTSPEGFPGGVVAFEASFRRGLGARYAFRLDGRPAGVWDTRGLGPPLPAPVANTPGAYRIRVPPAPPGARQVIDCRIDAVAGGADLLGWQLESRRPPLVVLVEHPRPPSFAIYRHGGWRFAPTDAQITALDRAIGSVAAEFDGYVLAVDPDAAIDRRPSDFLADGFHFSPAGNRVVAGVIEAAIAHDPHVR